MQSFSNNFLLFCPFINPSILITWKTKSPGITKASAPLPIDTSNQIIERLRQLYTKIFSIFLRLHGKSEFAGTGIGLAICKKIEQNYYEEIWATSQPGRDEQENLQDALQKLGIENELICFSNGTTALAYL